MAANALRIGLFRFTIAPVQSLQVPAVDDALRLVIELRNVGSYKRRDYSSNGA